MQNKLRFGIVGCGHIAKRHAENASRYGVLVAVCDIVKEKADKLSQSYNAKSYYTIEQLLQVANEMDVIAVCTPNGLHAKHAIQCLEAGVHVLCEKPMAITTASCQEMIKAANVSKKQLVVVKQNRFNSPVHELKNILSEGRLGKVYSVQVNCFWNRSVDYYKQADWRGTKELDGGILFTQFSHFIDILQWMIGDVEKVEAVLANYSHRGIVDFEDTGTVSFQFENGVMGNMMYTINSFKKNMEGSFTIFAEKGTVKIGGQYLNEIAFQSIDGFSIEQTTLASGSANDYGIYTGSMSNHDKVYANLVDVITHNAPATANAYEGMKTVEIIENIYKAARYI
ncbi:MAG: Gfo/Idh/MocA family oxidoreductase [Chitinophagaceae bacterium]